MKKIKNKLKLSKKTISSLTNDEMTSIEGGSNYCDTTGGQISYPSTCISYYNYRCQGGGSGTYPCYATGEAGCGGGPGTGASFVYGSACY